MENRRGGIAALSAIDTTDRRAPTFQNVTTRVPCNRQARTAIPSQTWRSLAIWFDIGNREKKCRIQTRANRPGNPDSAAGRVSRGKKTVSKKRPPESPAPVQLQSPDQDQPLQPQPVHAESPKVDRAAGHRRAGVPSPRRPSRCRPLRPRQPSPHLQPNLQRPNLQLARTRAGQTCNGRTRTGDLADHHERLSRLHQEIVRGVRVVFRAAQRRSVARKGDVCSHRICEAGLRDLRCRVRRRSANSTTGLPGKPSSPFKVWSARRGKRTASPEASREPALAQLHEHKRLRFSGAFCDIGMRVDKSAPSESICSTRFRSLSPAATNWPIRADLVNIRANLLPPFLRALP